MGNSERGKAESLVGGERSRYFYGFICGRGRDPGWSQRPYHLHEWTEGEKVDRRHGCETPNIAWIFELNGNGETVCASFFLVPRASWALKKDPPVVRYTRGRCTHKTSILESSSPIWFNVHKPSGAESLATPKTGRRRRGS